MTSSKPEYEYLCVSLPADYYLLFPYTWVLLSSVNAVTVYLLLCHSLHLIRINKSFFLYETQVVGIVIFGFNKSIKRKYIL